LVVVALNNKGIVATSMIGYQLIPDERIPLVFYDQIGNGASSHVKDAPEEVWTPESFMDQLDGLLIHLGIVDKFDFVGR
ncbi:hypothetical protein MPER_06025, partial [Moniliophthora perniciosa FA553]